MTRIIKELKKKLLAAEYEETAKEIKQINQELEGALSDGQDIPEHPVLPRQERK